jgi:hypothetical protein
LSLLSILALLLVPACDEDDGHVFDRTRIVWEERTIRDIDYVENTSFLFFDPFTFWRPPDPPTIRVYRELKPPEVGELGRSPFPARAWVDPADDGQSIRDALAPLETGGRPLDTPASEQGWFEPLVLGEDYTLVHYPGDPLIIGIELTEPISVLEQRALAASYVTLGGDEVGATYNDYRLSPLYPDTLALKLIKSRTPRSNGDFAHVWNYMMRNVYDLGLTDIDREYFELSIEDNLNPAREEETTPTGSDVPYLRIFGLDRYDAWGDPGADGKVDLSSGLIDLERGRLIFPALRAFAPPPDSVASWTGRAFSFEDPAYQPQYARSDSMYSASPSIAGFENLHQYRIRVRAGYLEP